MTTIRGHRPATQVKILHIKLHFSYNLNLDQIQNQEVVHPLRVSSCPICIASFPLLLRNPLWAFIRPGGNLQSEPRKSKSYEERGGGRRERGRPPHFPSFLQPRPPPPLQRASSAGRTIVSGRGASFTDSSLCSLPEAGLKQIIAHELYHVYNKVTNDCCFELQLVKLARKVFRVY